MGVLLLFIFGSLLMVLFLFGQSKTVEPKQPAEKVEI
jgi:hypothetical protein